MQTTKTITAMPLLMVTAIPNKFPYAIQLDVPAVPPVNIKDLAKNSTDILASKARVTRGRNRSSKKKGFLERFEEIPIELMIMMFGGFGLKGILKGTLDYNALLLKDKLTLLSSGDASVMQIANKLYVAMKTAADTQWVLGQQTVSVGPTGPSIGAVLPDVSVAPANLAASAVNSVLPDIPEYIPVDNKYIYKDFIIK